MLTRMVYLKSTIYEMRHSNKSIILNIWWVADYQHLNLVKSVSPLYVFQLLVSRTGSSCSRRRRIRSTVLRLSCRGCGLSSGASWERWRRGWRLGTQRRPRACRPISELSWRSYSSDTRSRCSMQKQTLMSSLAQDFNDLAWKLKMKNFLLKTKLKNVSTFSL